MSEEDKELLARIGQLAGQINRHKSQQNGQRPVANHHPAHHRHNVYRHASAPYPMRGHRIGRPPVHQHRTLHLNATGSSSNTRATNSGSETPPGWVARNDRHRQLINANIYEKESQNRTKAIEETRQKKLNSQRNREKALFNDFVQQHTVSHPVSTTQQPTSNNNEITVAGIQFRVMDGGKKLVKVPGASRVTTAQEIISWSPDAANTSSKTPKTAVIAGVKFYRTKTGNLVANRVVKEQRYVGAFKGSQYLIITRRSGVVKKVDELCKIFCTTGSCPKGPQCRYVHNPDKVALCKDFLKDGKCANGEFCDLSHDFTPERMPNCLHFAKGHCTKPDCPYTHSKASPGALVCRTFGFKGYCEKGAGCTERHVFECPDFSNTGRCKNKGCKLLHRERASVLRNQAKSDDAMEDLSSDDDSPNSDDVDSDEVAEFIEADSDDSDLESHQEFISL